MSHQVGRKARLNATLHSKLQIKRKRGKSEHWRRSSAGCEHILTREPRLDVQHKYSTLLVSHCDSARCAALVIARVQVREICTERACEPAGMSWGRGSFLSFGMVGASRFPRLRRNYDVHHREHRSYCTARVCAERGPIYRQRMAPEEAE